MAVPTGVAGVRTGVAVTGPGTTFTLLWRGFHSRTTAATPLVLARDATSATST